MSNPVPVKQRRRRIDSLQICAHDRERGEFSIILNRRNRQNDLTESSDLGWMTEAELRATLARWQKQIDILDGKVTLMEQLGISIR